MDGATTWAVIVPFEAGSDIGGDTGVVARRVSIAADDVDETLFASSHAPRKCTAWATEIHAAFGESDGRCTQ